MICMDGSAVDLPDMCYKRYMAAMIKMHQINSSSRKEIDASWKYDIEDDYQKRKIDKKG